MQRTPIRPNPTPSTHQVVSKELLESSEAAAAARSPNHRHRYVTYPMRFDLFADDFARVAKVRRRGDLAW